MSWLTATLALYRRVFSRAGQLALRNWPVLGTVFVYAVVMTTSALVAPRLGLLGGFLLSLVWASCVGSFLYLVEMLVRTGRVSWGDFRRSFGVYLWDVFHDVLHRPATNRVGDGVDDFLRNLYPDVAVDIAFPADGGVAL